VSVLADLFYHFVSWGVSKVKPGRYQFDRDIPWGALVKVMMRRMIWLGRGIAKTALLQGRPRLVFMASGVKLRNTRMIRFGKGVTLETGVLIDGLSRDGIRLGDNVTVGAYSIIRATGALTQLGVGVRMGNGSAVDAYSFIGAAGGVQIGSQVIMGQHISFHAENHQYGDLDTPIKEQGTSRQGIVIEDNCWIGSNVTFLDGTWVQTGCVIGAGSVVTGNIPEFSVAVGVPAKVVKVRARLEAKPSRNTGIRSLHPR